MYVLDCSDVLVGGVFPLGVRVSVGEKNLRDMISLIVIETDNIVC